MSHISMPSGIIRGRATSCCSLAIQTATARALCNAASDWVGYCIITIKRRRDRTPKVQSPNSDYPAAAIGDRGSPHNSLCYSVIPTRGFVDLATSYQLQVLPFQYFDHTGGISRGTLRHPS